MNNGSKLVLGLGIFAVVAVGGLYVMDRMASRQTNMAENALQAEALRLLGQGVQALPQHSDLNQDGVQEDIYAVAVANAKADSVLQGCTPVRRLVVLQVVKRKPTLLLQITESAMQDGKGNGLIPQRSAPEGYCFLLTRQGVEVAMLGGSDVALLVWDAGKQSMVWQPHSH